ncbi:hypothetical protein JTB14_017276 [Gonioctena quinquepunctata]|nr:hypothetical protein JTB14_017276 [Gonioctena quinquepunctata]
MMDFTKKNEIKHIFTAPYHPSSNGQVERQVQTIKRRLEKLGTYNIEITSPRLLFSLRTTPNCATGKSPAELLVGRRLRTIFDWVNPNFIHEDGSLTKKEIRSFELDDKVLFRNYNGDKWLPGKVQQKNGTFTYTITSLDGQKMSRHIDQLLPRVSVEDEESNELQNRHVAGLGAGVSNDTNDDSTTGIDLGQSTEDTSSRNTQMLRRSERNPRKPNYLRDFI